MVVFPNAAAPGVLHGIFTSLDGCATEAEAIQSVQSHKAKE